MTLGTELLLGLLYLCMTCAIQDNFVQVIGLLHQSVELPSKLSLPSPLQEINWNFESKGKSYKVAQFDNHQARFYKEQFNGRIKLLYDGTTLLIEDLRMEDSGNYTAQFILKKDDYFERFMLMVYEPVPDPSIMIVMEERTSNWCNATLHCSVPTNSSPLNYNWIYKNTDSVYEESGNTIHISLNNSWDMEFQCIVHNPADQKNVSKQEMCNAQDSVAVKRMSYVILISLLLMLFILLLVIWKIRRKGSSTLTEDDGQTQVAISDHQRYGSSEEEEEHGREQIQQEADTLYCEATFPTDTDNPSIQLKG
ncbi:SLAM family member 5-like isoform X2 [Rana temporaria]|uniref:SLAM family member 5-like isoform X2 n=1 Tax=Rana temporaria TaxID=8407 RepID=UPI001AAD803D|nr:SLAM family member 5-like isoform X2 [Rana temporaria]